MSFFLSSCKKGFMERLFREAFFNERMLLCALCKIFPELLQMQLFL